MTSDGLLVIQCLFGNVWRIFNSWYIPGTKVTPASFLLFLAFAGFVLRWLTRLFDVQIGANAAVHSATNIEPAAWPAWKPGAFNYRGD